MSLLRRLLTRTSRLRAVDFLGKVLSNPRLWPAQITRSTDSFEILPWIDGAERLHWYCVGGYHPVMIGDVFIDRYRILDKLGYGNNSTVWLAKDLHKGSYVAFKVCTASQTPNEEFSILRQLQDVRLGYQRPSTSNRIVPQLLDHFHIDGPNGRHECYIMSPTQGSIVQARAGRGLFSLTVARAMAARLALAVEAIHGLGHVHGDIQCNNILVGFTPASYLDSLSEEEMRARYGAPEEITVDRVGTRVSSTCPLKAVPPVSLGKTSALYTAEDAHALMISDFGEAWAPALSTRLGQDCHSCRSPLCYVPPDIHFRPLDVLGPSLDIWTLALALWQLLGQKSLFLDEEWNRDEMILDHIAILDHDKLPRSWEEKWEDLEDARYPHAPKRDYLDDDDVEDEPLRTLEGRFDDCIRAHRHRNPVYGELSAEETAAFLELMRGMLRFQPEDRLTIKEILCSEWMVKWAMPCLYGH